MLLLQHSLPKQLDGLRREAKRKHIVPSLFAQVLSWKPVNINRGPTPISAKFFEKMLYKPRLPNPPLGKNCHIAAIVYRSLHIRSA